MLDRSWKVALMATLALATCGMVASACGAAGDGSKFETEAQSSGTGGVGGSGGDATGSGASSHSGTGGEDLPPPGPTCEGLECQVKACSDEDGTTITGKVFAPNGALPLYNVIVYIPLYPDEPLEPIETGATCEQCSTTIDNVIRATLSDPTGEFKLTNVPVGEDIPLVVQVGKWRRRVTLPAVQACQQNALSDPNLTRLPRNKGEGDLPQMAITTGGCDRLPCLFRKLGLSDAEFTAKSGDGRMHVFTGEGSSPGGVDGAVATKPNLDLWNSPQNLKPYDIVILSCECSEQNGVKSDQQKGFMRDYLNGGGRVFATHFHYTWFRNGPAELASVANWGGGNSGNPYTIDTSFPKGAALVQWLQTVGTITNDQINFSSAANDLTTVNAGAQRWIYRPAGASSGTSAESVKYFTFNTPVGIDPENQCGRAVLSDLHVSSQAWPAGSNYPSACNDTELTDQEKALVFLFFDLASCVTPDKDPPKPPIPN